MSERAPENRDPDVIPPSVPYASSTTPSTARTPAWLIAAAWLFVGVPAAWGVSQTFVKSLALFKGQQPTPAAPTTAPTVMGAPTTVPSNPYPANAPGTTQPSGLTP